MIMRVIDACVDEGATSTVAWCSVGDRASREAACDLGRYDGRRFTQVYALRLDRMAGFRFAIALPSFDSVQAAIIC